MLNPTELLQKNAPKIYRRWLSKKRQSSVQVLSRNKDVIMWKVQSFSEHDKHYTVRHFTEGEWRCDCPKFIFSRGDCKHIKLVKLT